VSRSTSSSVNQQANASLAALGHACIAIATYRWFLHIKRTPWLSLAVRPQQPPRPKPRMLEVPFRPHAHVNALSLYGAVGLAAGLLPPVGCAARRPALRLRHGELLSFNRASSTEGYGREWADRRRGDVYGARILRAAAHRRIQSRRRARRWPALEAFGERTIERANSLGGRMTRPVVQQPDARSIRRLLVPVAPRHLCRR
jgi:hypothetical protein